MAPKPKYRRLTEEQQLLVMNFGMFAWRAMMTAGPSCSPGSSGSSGSTARAMMAGEATTAAAAATVQPKPLHDPAGKCSFAYR